MDESRLDAAGRPLPQVICPVCGYNPDCASPADRSHARPKPGDLSLCLKCGEVLEFDDAMIARLATVATLTALQTQPADWQLLCRAQALIRQQRYLG